ncbi:hypothetical protein [Janthinobacterium rivuli]|uniref:hypothetical protein n=1 Tax=Janthinobacterium sp. FT68W TaxID=2654255 RepID=UPI00186B0EF5|nr:hypothetical protein [Janthinobacterium sp. FT68W]
MKIFWLYAVVGTLYYMQYLADAPVLAKYAVGPVWLMMAAAPVLLAYLAALRFVRRIDP